MNQNKPPSLMRQYLEFIFVSPITTWWGAITFFIEVFAFLYLGQSIIINRIEILFLLLLVSLSVFVSFQVIYRGWRIFSKSREKIQVKGIIRIENDHFFLLQCNHNFTTGCLFEIYRNQESIEIPIGIIEVNNERTDGLVQAKPIWILPIHLRDIELHKLSVDNLVVKTSLSNSILPRWIEDQAEGKVQQLMKRGIR